MTAAMIFEAAKLWKAGCDTKQIEAHPTFRGAKITEDEIWNRLGAISLLARSLDEPEKVPA